MARSRAVTVGVASGIVGLVLGAAGAAWFLSKMLSYSAATAALATIAVDGAALEKLHSGDVEGASLALNRNLDGALITIRYAAEDGFKLPEKGALAIGRVGHVRAVTGYVPPDESVRASVNAALQLGREVK
jgi:hypothetical protein